MNSLQDGLQSDFTTEVRLAWSKVWHIVASTMIAAAWPAPFSTGFESMAAVGKKSSGSENSSIAGCEDMSTAVSENTDEQPEFTEALLEAPLSSMEVDVVR